MSTRAALAGAAMAAALMMFPARTPSQVAPLPTCRIPPGTAAKLSPILKARAAWPGVSTLRPVPPPPTKRATAHQRAQGEMMAQLRSFIERLLSVTLAPRDWDSSFLADRNGAIYCRVGPRGGYAEGLATYGKLTDSDCFSFYLRFRQPIPEVDGRAMQAGLRDVLSRSVAETVAGPGKTPRPDDMVNGGREYAAESVFDPERIDMLWDFLYLYESRDCLVGVFQSAPQGTASPPLPASKP